METYPVIDADAHVLEDLNALRAALPARWQRPGVLPRNPWDRAGPEPPPRIPQDYLRAMDAAGAAVMVLYPTHGLNLGMLKEVEYAVDLARVYNQWLHGFCAADPHRLKFMALVAPQDVEASAAELRHAVTELGALGAVLPTRIPLRPDYSHASYDPLYAEAVRLGVGLAFHPTTNQSLGTQRFSNLLNVFATAAPAECIVALLGTVTGGVAERFPDLRMAYLEGGVGWVPYMMDRMNEEVEKRGHIETPYLTRKPSEYIRGGRIFFGVDGLEPTLRDAAPWRLGGTMLFGSDYPQWFGGWPGALTGLRARTDLPDEVKRQLLYDNARAFYGADRLG